MGFWSASSAQDADGYVPDPYAIQIQPTPEEDNSPFTVIAKAPDFELVEITGSGLDRTQAEGKRCFIRSKANGQRPALFVYPLTQKWAVMLPTDVMNAANWQHDHIEKGANVGVKVTFTIKVDREEAVEHAEWIQSVNPHKRRYVFFPEEEQQALYFQMQNGTQALMAWEHGGLGSAVEDLTRLTLGEPLPSGVVSYQLQGLPELIQETGKQCGGDSAE